MDEKQMLLMAAKAAGERIARLADDYADWMAVHASDHGYQGNKDYPDYSATPEVLMAKEDLHMEIALLLRAVYAAIGEQSNG